MPSVVHTTIVYRNAENIKKSDMIIKFLYFYLFPFLNKRIKGVVVITACKQSCLPKTIDRVSFAGYLSHIQFVIC